MFNKTLLTAFACFAALFLNAQDTLYFDHDLQQVASSDQAVCYSFVGKKNEKITYHYLSGTLYAELVPENGITKVSLYYPSGQLKEQKTLKKDRQVDDYSNWYLNGQLREQGVFSNNGDYQIVAFYDSTGQKTAENNTGSIAVYEKDGITLKETGFIMNGFLVGAWKGYGADGTLLYEETYKAPGELVMGKSFLADTVISYTQLEVLAQPEIGMVPFLKKIAQTMAYPQKARSNKIQGKVMVGFWVRANGTTDSYTIVKGLGYGCDEETLRAIKEIDTSWNPKLIRGLPADQWLVLPISFHLAGIHK